MTERPELLTNPKAERVARVRGLSGRSARLRHGQFLVEGPQAVRELIRFAPGLIRDVYASAAHAELAAAAAAVTRFVYPVTDEVAAALSADSQGILAVAQLPEQVGLERLAGARLVVVLPAIADPGNAGTLIRVADAAGADAVVICAGGVELTNPKVVRASAGSIFHFPVVTGVSFEQTALAARAAGLQLVGADGAATQQLFDPAFAAAAPTAWVFGNEAHGLSDAERAACDSLVAIPLYGAAESLNVAAAAAVCLFHTARHQRG